ncbi:hypothetical protein PQX77_014700 [Marasmius sp. AFHP31]|nr:hypothetical protein PQX77_014700 [Marasmius sp. AFHP31]
MSTPSQTTDNPAKILRIFLAESSTSAMDEARADGESGLMYTYTFLATLIALFLVALTIVLRGRRAERRRMHILEEAIRNGTDVLGRRKDDNDAHNKPVLWETWVKLGKRGRYRSAEEGCQAVDGSSEHERKKTESVAWRNVRPLSLQIVQATTFDPGVANSTANTQALSSTSSPTPSVSTRSTQSSPIRLFCCLEALTASRRHDRTRPPPSHSSQPINSNIYSSSETNSVPSVRVLDVVHGDGTDTSLSPPQNTNTPVTTSMKLSAPIMRVSLLVAMPSPYLTKNGSLDEDDLPYMDVGIVDVEAISEAEKEEGGHCQEEVSA